jgi:hypothetical protein
MAGHRQARAAGSARELHKHTPAPPDDLRSPPPNRSLLSRTAETIPPSAAATTHPEPKRRRSAGRDRRPLDETAVSRRWRRRPCSVAGERERRTLARPLLKRFVPPCPSSDPARPTAPRPSWQPNATSDRRATRPSGTGTYSGQAWAPGTMAEPDARVNKCWANRAQQARAVETFPPPSRIRQDEQRRPRIPTTTVPSPHREAV